LWMRAPPPSHCGTRQGVMVIYQWFLNERSAQGARRIDPHRFAAVDRAMTLSARSRKRRAPGIDATHHDCLNRSQRASYKLCSDSDLASWGTTRHRQKTTPRACRQRNARARRCESSYGHGPMPAMVRPLEKIADRLRDGARRLTSGKVGESVAATDRPSAPPYATS